MAGWLTNDLPTIGPIVANGTTIAVVNLVNNGTVVTGGNAPVYTQLQADDLVPVDTGIPGGEVPQSVAATAFQIAAHAVGLISNTGSSTAGAATLNTVSGNVTTESLSTAPGSSYTFTLTNSLISATSPIPEIMLLDNTNTGGVTQLTSITNGAGSTVAVFTNVGTSAFNGKKSFVFHI